MQPVASNVDYLRVTAPRGASGKEVLRLWRARDAAIESEGNTREPKTFAAWGFAGFTTGSVSWGVRDNDAMLQVSGGAAAAAARCLQAEGIRVPRCDFAVTVWFPEDVENMVSQLVEQAVERRKETALTQRRRLTHLRGLGDGDTLQVGSRKSEQYGRIYDKGRETHDSYYENAWRWEVEFKNKAAAAAFAQVAGIEQPAPIVAGTVVRWFDKRGCAPIVEIPVGPGDFVLPSRTRPDDARRLEWLAKQVAPCLPGLIDRYGKDAILKTLGLHDS